MNTPQDIKEFEVLFRDPLLGDRTLMPPVVSLVCYNIRVALQRLGYEEGLDAPSGREQYEYNQSLINLVRRFQTNNNHEFCDGLFGPGTRRLLVSKMIETKGPGTFDRMQNPQEQEDMDVFLIKKEIEHQRHLLSIYRDNRRKLQIQAAEFGKMYIPLPLQNQLEEASQIVRETDQKIEDLKQILIKRAKNNDGP